MVDPPSISLCVDSEERDSVFQCDTDSCQYDGECLKIAETMTCVCDFKVSISLSLCFSFFLSVSSSLFSLSLSFEASLSSCIFTLSGQSLSVLQHQSHCSYLIHTNTHTVFIPICTICKISNISTSPWMSAIKKQIWNTIVVAEDIHQ